LLGEEGGRVIGYRDLAVVADVGKGGSTTDGIVVRAGEGLLVVVGVIDVVEEGLLMVVGNIVVVELLEKGAVGIGWRVVVPELGFDGDDVVVDGVVGDVDGVVLVIRKVDVVGRGGAGSRRVGVGGVRVEVKGGHCGETISAGDGFEQNNCLIGKGLRSQDPCHPALLDTHPLSRCHASCAPTCTASVISEL